MFHLKEAQFTLIMVMDARKRVVKRSIIVAMLVLKLFTIKVRSPFG